MGKLMVEMNGFVVYTDLKWLEKMFVDRNGPSDGVNSNMLCRNTNFRGENL